MLEVGAPIIFNLIDLKTELEINQYRVDLIGT